MTAILLEAALRALVLAAVVALALYLLRVRNVPALKTAWTLVLIASLAMPLLMRWPALAGVQHLGWTLPAALAQPDTGEAPEAVAPAFTMTAQPLSDSSSSTLNTAGVPATSSQISASASQSTAVTAAPSTAAEDAEAPRRHKEFPLSPAERIAAIYFAVSGALLLRLLWGLGVALRLWLRAERVSPLVAPEPYVRSSAKIASPVTIGSGIILPADYPQWDRRKLRMVLAHEQAHVRGLDFYLQFLAGLYAAVFWFSPLGWWLRRRLTALGEAMSDRAGIEAGASRTDYAQIVLEFAAVPRRGLPGVAMASSGNLSRRVESMLNETLFRTAFAEGRRRAAVALLIVPAALFAVTALIRVPAAAAQTPVPDPPPVQTASPAPAQDQQAPPGKPSPALPSSQSNPPAPKTGPGTHASLDDLPPITVPPVDVPPIDVPAIHTPPIHVPAISVPQIDVPQINVPPVSVPPIHVPAIDVPPVNVPAMDIPPIHVPAIHVSGINIPPVPPLDLTGPFGDATATAKLEHDLSVTVHGAIASAFVGDDRNGVSGYAYHFSENGDSWALVPGPSTTFSFSGNWPGNLQSEIAKARQIAHGPFLWFTHNGKSYIVQSPEIVARIRTLYAPMERLSFRQDALGREQQELGRQMEALGRAQKEAGKVSIPDLSKQMSDLNAAMAKLRAQQGKTMTQDDLSSLQAQIAALQGQLGRLQGEIGAREGGFGRQMGELGAAQGRIGEQQGQIGSEQGRIASEADQQVRSIIDESLRNGTAKPVP